MWRIMWHIVAHLWCDFYSFIFLYFYIYFLFFLFYRFFIFYYFYSMDFYYNDTYNKNLILSKILYSVTPHEKNNTPCGVFIIYLFLYATIVILSVTANPMLPFAFLSSHAIGKFFFSLLISLRYSFSEIGVHLLMSVVFPLILSVFSKV